VALDENTVFVSSSALEPCSFTLAS